MCSAAGRPAVRPAFADELVERRGEVTDAGLGRLREAATAALKRATRAPTRAIRGGADSPFSTDPFDVW